MAGSRGRRVDDDLHIPVTVWVPSAMHAQLRAVAQANGMNPDEVGPLLVEATRRQLAGAGPAQVKATRARWTDAESERLRELHAQKLSDRRIGEIMGRPQPTISVKRKELGLPRHNEPFGPKRPS